MEKFCQNDLCENEAVKQVPISVERPCDQKRALCAACQEAYHWGVQHGRMTPPNKQVWVLAVVERGAIVYGQVFRKRLRAIKGLAEYLRANEGYGGPATMPSLGAWLAEHDDRLGADVFPALIDWS
jgi:hypothetical protein